MNGEIETKVVNQNIIIMNKKCKFEKTITINTSSVWIGDPMYALSDERYRAISHDDGPIVLDGTEIGIVHGTFYRDGSYPGSKRKELTAAK